MQKPTIYVATLLLAACGPALAVNKCKGADGKTVYQDAPCAEGHKAEVLHIKAGTANALPPAKNTKPRESANSQANTTGYKTENYEKDGVMLSRVPVRGMTLAQLTERMGEPGVVPPKSCDPVIGVQLKFGRFIVGLVDGVVVHVRMDKGGPSYDRGECLDQIRDRGIESSKELNKKMQENNARMRLIPRQIDN